MQTVIPGRVNILKYLRSKGISLPAHCQGAGACGKCSVKLIAGSLDITPADRQLLSREQLEDGVRLACKAVTKAPVRIEIPDNDSSFNTPDKMWETPEHTHTFGIAADIGTTTIALSLVDITDRRAVRTVAAANSAAAFGADVITRIGSSLAGNRDAIKAAMQQDISSAAARLGAEGLDIKKASIAANTAMYHMLLGLDCSGLGKAPFSPATLGGETIPLSELLGESFKNACLPDIPATLIKGFGAFIGGDIASGLAATLDDERCTLFLDLGTNGEAVLFTGSELLCASAAAGPALEGGELSCGMGGVSGAVCRVYSKDGRLAFDTVDNASPKGICGSGAVDALAYCADSGLIDKRGVFLDNLADTGLMLTDKITLTQQDVRELQLAKAAIRACLDTLLERSHTDYEAIDRLVIAGGFGHFLDVKSACTIGLIPQKLREKAVTPGNTSLKGAQLSLFDEGFVKRLERLAGIAKILPLSEDEGFKERFIKSIDL